MRDLSGHTLSGRYRLLDRIAGGGMGDVYRGHDLLLDRPVAVKVLQPSLAADVSFVARFKHEARAVARLNHPNVVAVHDWGMDNLSSDGRAHPTGTYFMVMEHVSGTDVRELLSARGAVDPPQALHIVAAVCDALSAAHSAGLVHRDVKPENILLTADGEVKVADFGIASFEGSMTSPGGMVPGTLLYMAPEQAAGREATALSDIWGAGALLAELVTGKPPRSEKPAQRAVSVPEPPSLSSAEVPRSIDEIVLTACATDPDLRYGSAREMARAVKAALGRSDAHSLAGLTAAPTASQTPFDMIPTSVGVPRGRRRMARKRWLVVAAVLGSIALATSAVAALVAPGDVPVPGLMGMSKNKAMDTLSELGLEGRIAGTVRSWEVLAGRVIGQSPGSGTIEEGSEVELVISAGPPKVLLPDLTGMLLRDASARVAARGSAVGRITREHNEAPLDTVIGQSVKPGLMPFGSSIDLIVSRGPVPVTIPEVAGLDLKTAKQELKAAGFEIEVTEGFSDSVDEGVVISINPSGPGEAPKGSTIVVTVSKGPRFAEIVMPDVRGASVEAATAELEGLKLRVDVVQSCGGSGSIVSETDPISGTTIHENDLVVLFVC
jgi:eukaryotic-like serine/threonine-protein kinase